MHYQVENCVQNIHYNCTQTIVGVHKIFGFFSCMKCTTCTTVLCTVTVHSSVYRFII